MSHTNVPTVLYTKEDEKLENAVAAELLVPDPTEEEGALAIAKAKQEEDKDTALVGLKRPYVDLG